MTTSMGNHMGRSTTRRVPAALALGAVCLAVIVGALSAPASATRSEVGSGSVVKAAVVPSNITVTQTPSAVQGPCTFPLFALSNSVGGDAQTFVLRVTASAPLCSPIDATAAIYKMPGNGVAWPQQLVETKNVRIAAAGVTEIVFKKTCEAVQFDVINGATPQTISPTGPYHGPLLFPFDLNTSRQWWGSSCPDPSTTTTTSTPSGGCGDYQPTSDLAINVPAAAPGQTVILTGAAGPGQTVNIRIASLGGPPVSLGSAVAGPNGRFSANITIPADFDEGTYNITVTSEQCSTPSVITLVVRNPEGQCVDRVTVEANRGDTFTWTLLGRLATNKPVVVSLVPIFEGTTVQLYSGPYPSDRDVSLTIPVAQPSGRYRIDETGTNDQGVLVTAQCGRVQVAEGGGGVGTTTTTVVTSTTQATGSSTSTTVPGTTSTVPRTTTTEADRGNVLGTTVERQVTNIGSTSPASVLGTSTQRSGSGLAFTGSTIRPFIALGVALVAMGALLALAARRRRR